MKSTRFARLSFLNLLELREDQQNELMEIRNEDSVRSKMFTSRPIQSGEHREWIDSMRSDQRRTVWAVFLDTGLIGAVSMSNFSQQHQTADWAFYVSDRQQGTGVGGIIEFLFLEYVFDEVELAKLNCEVLASNPGVVRMHQKFGFAIEGTRRQNVAKEAAREDVILLGMLCQEWMQHRAKMLPLMDRVYHGLPQNH